MTREDSRRKRTLARELAVDLSVITVLGVLLAIIGPFGTFGEPLATRLGVWLGLVFAGYAIYAPLGMLVDRFSRLLDLPRAGLWVAGVLLATVPMAAIVWSLNGLYGPLTMPDGQAALNHYLNVLVVGAAVTLLFQLLDRKPDQPAPVPPIVADTAAEPGRPTARFLDRLPPALGSDLLALEMEDHYVRAHTALGSELVLLRMRDAVAELDPVDGLQVHRSWWVARGAVRDAKRDGRNVRLVLDNGLEAPVSRANVQMLKDAGWL